MNNEQNQFENNEQVSVNNKPNVQFESNIINLPEEYKPISMWGYFGYQLLFSIPCIGFILLCVFAFGGAKNVNLKNFARSYFCYIIIMAVLVFLILVFFGGIAAFTQVSSNSATYY